MIEFFHFLDTLGGEVGLALSACMSLTGGLQYGMRQSAEMENQMTSVERVLEYGNLELEADLNKPIANGLSSKENHGRSANRRSIIYFFIFLKYLGEEAEGDEWPNQGVVEFKDVFLRYSEFDDWILKGISFKTKPIEKVFTIYILKS